MSTYASKTTVGADKTLSDIRSVLSRYGAEQFAYMESPHVATVAFVKSGRQIRFTIDLPDRSERQFTHHSRGARTATAAAAAHEQAVRQRWRALLLIIKAKLEAVESGIVTFDQEFAMHMMLPGGVHVGEAVSGAISRSLDSGATFALQLASGAEGGEA